MTNSKKIIIVGGGAAGFFAALACKDAAPENEVIILEKTQQPLSKVRISGGGRCNVTHHCYDIPRLVCSYPRGNKALKATFSRFQPQDTVRWFESHNVKLKTEEDGRMFPMTDSSETIIECFIKEAQRLNVIVMKGVCVEKILPLENGFEIHTQDQSMYYADKLLLATGSSRYIWDLLHQLGHQIVPPVPSLFTFNVPSSPLLDLAGVSVPKVEVKIENTNLEQTGPILMTHWGFSGPCILKLSAWGARILHDMQYQAVCIIDWIPDLGTDQLKHFLMNKRITEGNKSIGTEGLFGLAKALMRRLIETTGIDPNKRWSHLNQKEILQLQTALKSSRYFVEGKTTYKQEFVTCGGIVLDEVDFRTMQSKLYPNLFFAGEILNIDGITGGFNFQNAWTTGWIAAQAMAKS